MKSVKKLTTIQAYIKETHCLIVGLQYVQGCHYVHLINIAPKDHITVDKARSGYFTISFFEKILDRKLDSKFVYENAKIGLLRLPMHHHEGWQP